MINNIIQFSIKNKLIVGILLLMLIAWGSSALIHLPIDAVPDITNNQVQVITSTPTLATQEVEQFVTAPIERSIGNLPDVEEIRSVSRFGLSVVTIVFDDKVDIYFARQLVDQKLQEAEDQIPEGVGKPEMAPVSTGLGEIYQYVLYAKEGYEDKYSDMDLRTMQDWIVARQLIGTPGVAEVNSFGGRVKQYEVAIDPVKLKSMQITIPEIFEALQDNNENTGGAYIEKQSNSYYIRGVGLAKNFEDIEKIVVKNNSNTIPVLIRDVATVQFGHAPRYGAQTRNGEGEVVGGIVMMLKGENSEEVVHNIKERMVTIEKSLPEGVGVEVYLDRTDLIGRTIKTVETNLLEGALIVIFILVLFLGHLRAGLIVASVIPISMLFAVGMMSLFGVSANLMSLGAIDFGIIVDAAVIIVEATVFHISNLKLNRKLTQAEMDTEVFNSASKIRKSAAFGEIIILIVYLPILSLQGIEGKMFGPMAQTVGFAIIGALILSLTYVPMMSALFLSKNTSFKKNYSDKMMAFFQRLYAPVLAFAMRAKLTVVLISVLLFSISIWIFNNLGGEFIPTLEEGDFAFHSILAQGSSLSQSIENNAKVEKIIMQFPEVREVIGKTGSAEVPTDPMPPEATDIIIVLKDKSEWVTTKNYNDLADSMMHALKNIPGVFFEINQPIQMRFNELMTGVRQDVAVKLFGENMDTLLFYANKIAAVIPEVRGAGNPQTEKISGLPQIAINYNRDRMAQYGFTISEINNIVKTAFAGETTGFIFEDEKKFDLVVRLDSDYRTDIGDVQNLFIPIQGGGQVPLNQVADIQFESGPAQISREDGKRRIVIGLNVVNRDVQSVVEDMQKKIEEEVKLPMGYFVTYGGQFENLQEATKRLQIALPVALLLILILLYFTFNSLKQAVLIFTAIPLSAIGGVFALYLRDMPFSISAGVGFIALFGVAVLNGIVLLSTFNQLQKEGITDINERVKLGTTTRLRPVLMTALVASLGFLPMALSHSAGAEVQRPLATVVIGGLISATALTLIVLPAMYILFSGKRKKTAMPPAVLILFTVIGICATTNSFAQNTKPLPLDSVQQITLRNNPQIKVAKLEIERDQALKKTSFDLPNTEIFFENEDILISNSDNGILKIGFEQRIEFPTTYIVKNKINSQQISIGNTVLSLTEKDLLREVNAAYNNLIYISERWKLLQKQDSMFADYAKSAERRYKEGESNYLEFISAETKRKELILLRSNAEQEIKKAQIRIKELMVVDYFITPAESKFSGMIYNIGVINNAHPFLDYYQQQIQLADKKKDLAVNNMLPDIGFRYFNQNWFGIEPGYQGYAVSVGIPIAFWSYSGKIKAAAKQIQINEQLLEKETIRFNTAYTQLLYQYEIAKATVQYFETGALIKADEIRNTADDSYKAGEIGYFELMYAIQQYFDMQFEYLKAIEDLNQTIIQLKYYQEQ